MTFLFVFFSGVVLSFLFLDLTDGVVRPKEKQSKKPVDKDAAVKRNTAAQSGERRAGPAEAKLQPEKHVALSSAKDLEESGDEGCASGDDDVSDISDGGEFEPTGSSDEVCQPPICLSLASIPNFHNCVSL